MFESDEYEEEVPASRLVTGNGVVLAGWWDSPPDVTIKKALWPIIVVGEMCLVIDDTLHYTVDGEEVFRWPDAFDEGGRG